MAARGIRTLAYAVRGRVVAQRLGQLLLPSTVLAIPPMTVALVSGNAGFFLRCTVIAAGLLAVGGALARIEAPTGVRPNEAMAVTALTFLVAAMAMVWPFAAEGLGGLDAWFESVSAITTTGLTTIAEIEVHSPAFLFTRAWMQWYGGLAIVVLAVALVLEPGVAARRLAGAEAEMPEVVGGTRSRARQAIVVYVSLSVIAVTLFMLAGADPFDALVHGLAAVSTGGFSSHSDSLNGVGGPGVQIVATAMSFCGALSLMLYVRVRQGRWRGALLDPDLHALLYALLLCAALVGLFMVLVGGRPWAEALRHAPLMAVSAQTTTGFATLDVGGLDAASKLSLIVSMFIGGDTGSTAGGIKIARLLVMFALIRLVFMRTRLPPHAVAGPTLSGPRLEGAEVQAALAIVILHTIVIGTSWLAFVAGGHDALNALFEVTSATGTVGLSTGITGTGLAPALKMVLIVDMLMGRLEIVAFIVLLYPPTWFGRRAEVS